MGSVFYLKEQGGSGWWGEDGGREGVWAGAGAKEFFRGRNSRQASYPAQHHRPIIPMLVRWNVEKCIALREICRASFGGGMWGFGGWEGAGGRVAENQGFLNPRFRNL